MNRWGERTNAPSHHFPSKISEVINHGISFRSLGLPQNLCFRNGECGGQVNKSQTGTQKTAEKPNIFCWINRFFTAGTISWFDLDKSSGRFHTPRPINWLSPQIKRNQIDPWPSDVLRPKAYENVHWHWAPIKCRVERFLGYKKIPSPGEIVGKHGEFGKHGENNWLCNHGNCLFKIRSLYGVIKVSCRMLQHISCHTSKEGLGLASNKLRGNVFCNGLQSPLNLSN